MRYRGIGAALFWTTVGALGGVVAGACGPPAPYVRYTGTNFGRPAKPAETMEVYRGEVPWGRFQDLGTVTVTCPSQGQNVFGAVQQFGGCEYDWAVVQACKRASSNGGDGIHAIETSVNTSGRVVSLRASVFVRLPTRVATQPVVAAQKPTEATAERKPAVEERLRNLDKLKQDGLINQAEYDRKRQEILDDI